MGSVDHYPLEAYEGKTSSCPGRVFQPAQVTVQIAMAVAIDLVEWDQGFDAETMEGIVDDQSRLQVFRTAVTFEKRSNASAAEDQSEENILHGGCFRLGFQ